MTRLRAAASLAATALSLSLAAPAKAYPVDCAILLCLAGGWPASAECAHARAVFIRRITPWPIELAGDSAARLVVHLGVSDANGLLAYEAMLDGARSHVYVVNDFPVVASLAMAVRLLKLQDKRSSSDES